MALGPPVCRANPAGGVFDLLNPGIARDLGLGGDPFRTSMTDQASWWGESVQARQPSLQYEMEYFEPVSPWLTDGNGWLTHNANRLRGAASASVGEGRLYGQLGLAGVDQELHVDELGDRYAIYGKGNQGELLVRLQDLPEGLTTQVTLPLGASNDHMRSMPLGLGIRYMAPGKFAIQASRVRRLYNHAVDIQVEDDQVESALNLERTITTIDTRLDLGPASCLGYTFRTNDYGEIDQRTDAYRYEIIPTGRTTSYELEVGIGLGGESTVLLRGVWLEFDLGGSAYWGGQRFAKINYFQGDHRTGVLGFQKLCGDKTRWLADLTWTELAGEAWGRIESWPFTDSIGDLIGARMTVKGQFKANWTRLHAGLDRSVGRGNLKAGLAWYNMFPEAQARYWKSGLGFPIGSREEISLDADHVQLGALSLGGVIPMGSFRLDLEVFQVVYGNIHRSITGSDDGNEGGGGDPPAAPETEPSGWYGGTFARAGLGYHF